MIRPEPGLRGVLADNPSPMTGPGTTTWILGHGAVAVIDPGPADPRHLAAIEAALAGEAISHILVTHAHLDHSALAPTLARRSGAPVLAYGDALAGRSVRMSALADLGGLPDAEGCDRTFAPDAVLADGDQVAGSDWAVTALYTPGHFGNHLCFAWGDRVFCGDLVMGWSTSIVAPPDGDMGDYLASIARLQALAPARLYPTHGDPVDDPGARIAELIAHRQARAAQILAALAGGPATPTALAARIYTGTPSALLPAAAMNVLAHLIDLAGRNLAEPLGPITAATRFRLVR